MNLKNKSLTSIVLNNFTNDSRVLKENISLQNAGYEVKVVALWEEGLEEFEMIENIAVHRIKLKSKAWLKHRVVQLIKYFEFLYRAVKKYKNVDIVHCNDLNTLPIGVAIKRFFNKKVKIVYDAHEHETERYNQGKIEKKLARLLEIFLLKYVDSVITVSESIANDYVKLYGIKKPNLVFNTPNYRKVEKKDFFRKKFNIPKESTIFLYQGGVSKGRGILEFAELIKNKVGMVYVIMGYGLLESDIKKFIQSTNNVFFHEAVSPEILLDYTSSADIGVCIEENLCKSWDYALPNKMFEYNMVGLPIIVSGLYEMKKFVKENDTGFVLDNIFDKHEFNSKIDNIIETYSDKKKNIDRVKNIYNWEEQEKTLLKIYENLKENKDVEQV